MTAVLEAEAPEDRPRKIVGELDWSDKVFRATLRTAGLTVLLVTGCIALFLLLRGWQALRVAKWKFFTTTVWQPDGHHFGIVGLLVGTLLIGAVAMVFAVPLAFGIALYISEYAPSWLKRKLVTIVDVAAAVPSIVYGLWGFWFLQEHVYGVSRWIFTYFGWIPLFHVARADPHDPLASATVYSASTFIAGIVVALMVTPVTSSIMREAFSQAPLGEREGAYALGATRWGMIRAVVLPYGRGGIIGGSMLGLGRALGETIAVFYIISIVYVLQPNILQAGGVSVSSLIAATSGSATPFGVAALFAAGLALFVMTMGLNFLAAVFISRSRSGSEV
ncbi:MAG: phosphate transport system permease protein [Frankiales bacterium]|nr:phosphate transport system permease protein [Frankiales bacterium]MDX6245413.1 phosphate transport system permease protein [Frankiales bacterium]